jgi:hypothetical protein
MNTTSRQLFLYFHFKSAFFSTSKVQTGAVLNFDGSSDCVNADQFSISVAPSQKPAVSNDLTSFVINGLS